MEIYNFLVGLYGQFLGIFPVQIQWLVTLLVLMGLIGAFIALIRFNWMFLILLILLLPAIIPILQHFVLNVYDFVIYLLQALKATAP
jgi:hypothetical protein